MNQVANNNSINWRKKWLKRSAFLVSILAIFAIFSTAHAKGADQFSGLGVFNELTGDCANPPPGPNGEDAAFALEFTGDLEGCLFTYPGPGGCNAGGVFMEEGTEIFVGTYKGSEVGTFTTDYTFTAKFRDCENFAGQISGGCQHVMRAGSGTGFFEGKQLRFLIRDDIGPTETTFPYKGHIK